MLWALTDHLGTVRDVIDNSGTVIDHAQYDAFGNRLDAAAVDVVFGYTGKLFDEATGLQNNWNRWYDPAVGRWVSEDPIGFGGGDANLNRYTFNQPSRFTDPTGEIVPLLVIGGLAGANYWIWGNNAAAIDDLVNDRPINPSNTPYSGDYYKGLAKSTATGSVVAVATPVIASTAPAWATTTCALGAGGYGVYNNGATALDAFGNGNYATGVYHIGIAGMSGYGTVQVAKPVLGIQQVPHRIPLREYWRWREQGYTPSEAGYLVRPYPPSKQGKGNHFIPQRFGTEKGGWVPSRIIESPYNVMKPLGISRGRFYERHALGDRQWRGCSFPDAQGGGSWSRSRFMPSPDWRHWLNSPFYGMPDQTQGVTMILIVTTEGLILGEVGDFDEQVPNLQIQVQR